MKDKIILDNETYKRIERKIYEYFESKKEINVLEGDVEVLQKNVEQIQRDIQTLSTRFNNKSTFADKQIQEAITKLENESTMKIRRILKLKNKVRSIEEKNSRIKNNIETLDKMSKAILENKYSRKRSNVAIGMDLGYSEHGIRKRNKKIICEIGKFMRWI